MSNPQMSPAFGLAARLALFYASLFVVIGVQLPFMPVWLAATGFDAGAIGLVLAAPTVLRMLVIPRLTRHVDGADSLRSAIVLVCAGAALAFLVLGLAEARWLIALLYVVAATALASAMPLAEAYAIRGLADPRRSYGPVRLWGSAAFIAGSFGAGVALDRIAATDLVWLLVAAMLAAAAVSCLLAPLPASAAAGPAVGATPLLRRPLFLAVLAAAGLIQASHAVYYGFSALDWRMAGLDGGTVAGLWALGVAAEIGLFAVSGRLPRWLGPTRLLMLGGAGAALRWTAMALDPAPAALPLLQALHALSFGATHLGTIGLIARLAPPRQGSTAQGYAAIVTGGLMALSTAGSGFLYGALGGLAYAGMAAAALAGTGFAVAAHRAWHRGEPR